MRTGALARQNMFLGGLTQSQIGDMVNQYQANQPSATSATPPVAPVAPPPPNLYANKPVVPKDATDIQLGVVTPEQIATVQTVTTTNTAAANGSVNYINNPMSIGFDNEEKLRKSLVTSEG